MKQSGITLMILTFLFACIAIGTNAQADSGTIVIVNKSVSENTISDRDLKQIFLGKQTRWSDDQKITFYTLDMPDLHESFLKQFIKKTPSQFANFWKKQVFTGKGKMPSSVQTEAMMIEFVIKTQGAVGYISNTAQTDTVKTITVD